MDKKMSSEVFTIIDGESRIEANSDTILSVLETHPDYHFAGCHAKIGAKVAAVVSLGLGTLGLLITAATVLQSYEIGYCCLLIPLFRCFLFNIAFGVMLVVGIHTENRLFLQAVTVGKLIELVSLIGSIVSIVSDQITNDDNLLGTQDWDIAVVLVVLVLYAVLLVVQVVSVHQYYKYLTAVQLMYIIGDKPKNHFIIRL